MWSYLYSLRIAAFAGNDHRHSVAIAGHYGFTLPLPWARGGTKMATPGIGFVTHLALQP